jgi:plastocyanin
MRSKRPIRRTSRFALAAGFAAALLVLAPTAALAASVSITDFQFTPATVTIHAGDSVTWTNNSAAGTPHTSTSDNGAWDSGTINPGSSFTHTFATAGTFTYHCNFHPQMHGTVIVEAAQTTPPPTSPGGGGGGGEPSPTQTSLAFTGSSHPITPFVLLAVGLALVGVTLLLASARRRGRA